MKCEKLSFTDLAGLAKVEWQYDKTFTVIFEGHDYDILIELTSNGDQEDPALEIEFTQGLRRLTPEEAALLFKIVTEFIANYEFPCGYKSMLS